MRHKRGILFSRDTRQVSLAALWRDGEEPGEPVSLIEAHEGIGAGTYRIKQDESGFLRSLARRLESLGREG